MNQSYFLAQLMGPICIIVSISFLMNRQSYVKITDGFLVNAGTMYIGAFMALVVGFLIVLTHNIWELSWVGIITLIGWIGVIKGIWLLLFPDYVEQFIRSYRAHNKALTIQLSLTLLFGIYLTVKGYF